jgi:hypothetical protein
MEGSLNGLAVSFLQGRALRQCGGLIFLLMRGVALTLHLIVKTAIVGMEEIPCLRNGKLRQQELNSALEAQISDIWEFSLNSVPNGDGFAQKSKRHVRVGVKLLPYSTFLRIQEVRLWPPLLAERKYVILMLRAAW